jgi:hypothetical protein
MTDIDLLVKEKDLAVADRVMADLGYSSVPCLKPKQRYRENHFHLPPYQHPKNR